MKEGRGKADGKRKEERGMAAKQRARF